jgi:hypothetical protein
MEIGDQGFRQAVAGFGSIQGQQRDVADLLVK